MDPSAEPLSYEPLPGHPPPPRAFTQGVGTVFQFVGVTLFLCTMGVCCATSLLSKETAQRKDWAAVGWGRRVEQVAPFQRAVRPVYPASRAVAVCVAVSMVSGIAAAGLGLGLQAQNRKAPAGAVLVTAFAAGFWVVHFVFFVQNLHSVLAGVLTSILALLFGALCLLAVAAWREMRRDPPPNGHEVLPADYKVPYSHFHQDPPEVRLAKEMDERRQRLLVQQKELEALEERIRRQRRQRGEEP